MFKKVHLMMDMNNLSKNTNTVIVQFKSMTDSVFAGIFPVENRMDLHFIKSLWT